MKTTQLIKTMPTPKLENLHFQKKFLPFIETELLSRVPNKWQIRQGEYEMAPYVVIPDADDAERYAETKFGHPLLRTPLILMYIGLDHFRVGAGLGASKKSLIRHINIVHHQVMPDWDLQLLQLLPEGLADLRRYTKELDNLHAPAHIKRHGRWIDKIIPNAREYRNEFLKRGGWIDKAEKFEYTPDDKIPEYLRSEFFSLARFLEWCLNFPQACSMWKKPAVLTNRLLFRWTSS